MLLNGMLCNLEAWHGISEKDISLLEKVDEVLLGESYAPTQKFHWRRYV